MHRGPLAAARHQPRPSVPFGSSTKARPRPPSSRPGWRPLRDDPRHETHVRRARGTARPGRLGPPAHPPEPLLPGGQRCSCRQSRVHGDGEAARAFRGRTFRPRRARHPTHPPRPGLPRGPRPPAELPGHERAPLFPAPVFRRRAHHPQDRHPDGRPCPQDGRPLPGSPVPGRPLGVLPCLREPVRWFQGAGGKGLCAAPGQEIGVRARRSAVGGRAPGGALFPRTAPREGDALPGFRREPRPPLARAGAPRAGRVAPGAAGRLQAAASGHARGLRDAGAGRAPRGGRLEVDTGEAPILVPELETDVHDLAGLRQVAKALLPE